MLWKVIIVSGSGRARVGDVYGLFPKKSVYVMIILQLPFLSHSPWLPQLCVQGHWCLQTTSTELPCLLSVHWVPQREAPAGVCMAEKGSRRHSFSIWAPPAWPWLVVPDSFSTGHGSYWMPPPPAGEFGRGQFFLTVVQWEQLPLLLPLVTPMVRTRVPSWSHWLSHEDSLALCLQVGFPREEPWQGFVGWEVRVTGIHCHQ